MQTWNTMAITRILFLWGEEGLRLAGWGQTQTSHLKLGNKRDLGRLGVTVAGRCPQPVTL